MSNYLHSVPANQGNTSDYAGFEPSPVKTKVINNSGAKSFQHSGRQTPLTTSLKQLSSAERVRVNSTQMVQKQVEQPRTQFKITKESKSSSNLHAKKPGTSFQLQPSGRPSLKAKQSYRGRDGHKWDLMRDSGVFTKNLLNYSD